MSLTNGPSIMILGRLGVFPTQTMAPDPIHFIRETRILVHAYRRVCAQLLPRSAAAPGFPILGRPRTWHPCSQPAWHLA